MDYHRDYNFQAKCRNCRNWFLQFVKPSKSFYITVHRGLEIFYNLIIVMSRQVNLLLQTAEFLNAALITLTWLNSSALRHLKPHIHFTATAFFNFPQYKTIWIFKQNSELHNENKSNWYSAAHLSCTLQQLQKCQKSSEGERD